MDALAGRQPWRGWDAASALRRRTGSPCVSSTGVSLRPGASTASAGVGGTGHVGSRTRSVAKARSWYTLSPSLSLQRYPNSKSPLLRLEVRVRMLMISCTPQPFIWRETTLNDPFFLV